MLPVRQRVAQLFAGDVRRGRRRKAPETIGERAEHFVRHAPRNEPNRAGGIARRGKRSCSKATGLAPTTAVLSPAACTRSAKVGTRIYFPPVNSSPRRTAASASMPISFNGVNLPPIFLVRRDAAAARKHARGEHRAIYLGRGGINTMMIREPNSAFAQAVQCRESVRARQNPAASRPKQSGQNTWPVPPQITRS